MYTYNVHHKWYNDNTSDSGDSYTSDSGDSYTSDSGDSYTSDSGDSYTSDSGDSYTSESGGSEHHNRRQSFKIYSSDSNVLKIKDSNKGFKTPDNEKKYVVNKIVVKGVVTPGAIYNKRSLEFLSSETFNGDKNFVTMFIAKNNFCSIDATKFELLKQIRKKNSRNKICVPELIFLENCQSSELMQHISKLPQMTEILRNNKDLFVIYAADAGDPIDNIQENETPSLSTIGIDDLYKAISRLIQTHSIISKEGFLHRGITCNNVTYKRDSKNKVSFYLSGVDLCFNDWNRIDKVNLSIHRKVVENLSLLVPIEQYFFRILLYLWFDLVLNGKVTRVLYDSLTNRFQNEQPAKNREYLVQLKREYFHDLLDKIESYFRKLYTTSQMDQTWQSCHKIMHTVSTDELEKKIISEATINKASGYNTKWSSFEVYDEMYTKFSKRFYSEFKNDQKKHHDNIGMCFDKHALGVLIRVLLECKTLVDSPSYNKSIELAFDLMFSREKLSKISKGFDELVYGWSTRQNTTQSNDKELNINSIRVNGIDKALSLMYDMKLQNSKPIEETNSVPAIYPVMLAKHNTQNVPRGIPVAIIQGQMPHVQMFPGKIIGQPVFQQQPGPNYSIHRK